MTDANASDICYFSHLSGSYFTLCSYGCRELDLSREAALRRAAEARLDQLIDMYGDPGVTAELNRRLPHARTRVSHVTGSADTSCDRIS